MAVRQTPSPGSGLDPPRRTLLLITASAPEIREVRRWRVLSFQQITMPYLAAFVPDHWTVLHVDEEVSEVDPNVPADLVGITFHTPSAPHAYAIAESFRCRGVPVVLGGPHVTLLPDEAQARADAIIVGEAETLWPRFLADFDTGEWAARYGPDPVPDLADVPMARKDLYHRDDLTAGRLFATRGCPHACDFCAIAVMYGRRVRTRPVDRVAAEYGSFPGRVIILWDDNLAADRAYAKDLFKALVPHRKWWSAQVGIEAGSDPEWLDLAARSGCKQLFVGLESISQASVNGVRKSFNRVDRYARIIDAIHRHGIAVQAGIVFGFDHDTETIFAETLAFLEQTGIQNATFNILTPYPGTPLFERLEREGRILTRDWRRYDGRTNVVFRPRQMTPETLLSGFRWANRRFYSAAGIVGRLSRSPVGLWWTLPLNLAYSLSLRRHDRHRRAA